MWMSQHGTRIYHAFRSDIPPCKLWSDLTNARKHSLAIIYHPCRTHETHGRQVQMLQSQNKFNVIIKNPPVSGGFFYFLE